MSDVTTSPGTDAERMMVGVSGELILGERFDRALVFASDLHRDQARKGPKQVPYISHLFGVASIVIENGGDEDQAIAALLHDGPEDHGGMETLERIREEFGERVAMIVAECSDTFETPKPPWRERKQAYLERLERAPEDVLLVSLADKVHNAQTILTDYREVGEELWERFSGTPAESLWYYRELVKMFARRRPGVPADELRRIVDEIDALVPEQGDPH